ncbi:MAG: response regulator, partial [Mariprofundus sp.]
AVSALKKAGFATCEAADGEAALEQFRLCQPDILLLDIEMPKCNGYSVCEQVRASRQGRHTPILMLTGHEDPASVDRAYQVGATDFISKPVNWNLLGHRTRYLLRNARTFQRAEQQRKQLEQAENIARLGSWQWDFASGDLTGSLGLRRLFGFEISQRLNIELYLQHVLEDDREAARAFIKAYPGQEDLAAFEHTRRITMQNGQQRVLQVRGTPCFDATGHAVSAEGTMLDITDMVQLEDEKKAICKQLEHAQHMESLGVMTGGIAHDFNNMLAAIISNLYLTKMMAKGNPALEHKLAVIEDICNRAAAIIRAMLTFARNDHVRKTTTDLHLLMQETCTLLRSGMPKSMQFIEDISPLPMPCLMNITQIQQVLMNLVNNAQFAVQEVTEPVIIITAAPYTPTRKDSHKAHSLSSNTWVRLQVQDNGSGITAEDQKKIFDPFFTTKEVGQGTGLGLSMAYGAIESHGGFIDVCSQPAEGTTFSIYLPMSACVALQRPATPAADPYGNGETILIVDDNDDLRLTTSAILNKMGYKTLEARNGKEGVALFTEHSDQITLILMDVVMPVLGGILAARDIRRKKPDVPIVFITGYDLNSSMVKEINIPRSQVLSKPFTMQSMQRLIDDILHPIS